MINVFNKILYFLFLLQLVFCEENKNYYFYYPEIDYGSEVYFNPLSLILNGGYDVLRNGRHTKDITDEYYAQGARNVWKNITHPIDNIEKFGWRRFLTSEIFPVSTKSEDFQYFPNYANHLVGHGLKYVRTAEWYDYHGFKYPYLWSIVTTFCYAFLNEVVENGKSKAVNVDPIADMIFFNPLGILLFSTNWARRFFSEKVPIYDWSLQPIFNPFNYHLNNAGEQYIIRISFSQKYSGFFYWGTSGIGGLTYKCSDGKNYSFGIGGIVNRLIERRLIKSDFFARYVAPETIDGAIGFFYDRNNSLLISLIMTGPIYYNGWLNIYPGLVRVRSLKPGLFLGIGELDKFQIGLTLAYIPFGLGVGK
jgi:hypothetical protein